MSKYHTMHNCIKYKGVLITTLIIFLISFYILVKVTSTVSNNMLD